MNINEIVGRLKAGGLDASSTNRSAAVYVTEARSGRAEPGWFGFRIICDSEATERRVRSILSRWYDIDAVGNVWRLRSKNRVPLMAIKRGGVPPIPPTPTGDYMYFEAVQAGSTVSLMSMLAIAPDLEYSRDGETWQEWQHTTAEGTHTFDTITLTAVGDRVYLRGLNSSMADVQNELMSMFTLSGSIAAGGSVTSLLDNDGVTLTAIPDGGFSFLFGKAIMDEIPDTALISPPSLGNASAIGNLGCVGMFYGCSNLQSVANMGKITNIGTMGCNLMYAGGCEALTSAADMLTNIVIGEDGCRGMYTDSLIELVSDENLTFQFPPLPYTAGSATFTTAQDVADWMTEVN